MKTYFEGEAVAMEDEPQTFGVRGGAPRHVLIVDDDPITRMVFHRLVSRAGFAADVAVSVEAALELLRLWRYDMVIVDCHLPDFHGEKLVKAIRSDSRHGKIPIVAVSSDDGDGNVLRMSGVNEFLVKPVSAAQVKGFLHRWLTGISS